MYAKTGHAATPIRARPRVALGLAVSRECRCSVTGIVGIYSDPKHLIVYTSNGEQGTSSPSSSPPGLSAAGDHLGRRIRKWHSFARLPFAGTGTGTGEGDPALKRYQVPGGRKPPVTLASNSAKVMTVSSS